MTVQNTATTTLTLAGGASAIVWLSSGHHSPMPEDVALYFLALGATAAHALGLFFGPILSAMSAALVRKFTPAPTQHQEQPHA